jgi:hypothetical protein
MKSKEKYEVWQKWRGMHPVGVRETVLISTGDMSLCPDRHVTVAGLTSRCVTDCAMVRQSIL